MARDPATTPTESARDPELLEPELPALLPETVREDASPGALLAPAPAPPPGTALAPLEEPVLPSAARSPAPDAHARFLACRHYASLDGLRALGILAVIWHHSVGGSGRFGANLFFLLSGFLVTTILVRERDRRGTVDVTRFRARRARRLYPLYFTVLLAYVVLVGALEPAGPSRAAFFDHLPAFATFTTNLFVGLEGEHVIFYFAWSLAAQEQFNLWWPLFLKRLDPRECAGALLSLLVAFWLTRAGLFDAALPRGSGLRALVLSILPALCMGSLLGLALHGRAGFDGLARFLGSRQASSVLLALAIALWCLPTAPEPLVQVVLTALTAACVLREDHALAALLKHRVLVHIGTVSYGIYLLHMLCHNVVGRVLALGGPASYPAFDFVLTALLAVGIATLSHRHFEHRFLPADKRVGHQRA